MKLSKSLALGLLTSSLLIFSGCSDSDNNSTEEEVTEEVTLSNPLTGYVVDSGVAGLSYSCNPSGVTGVTGVDGNFTCDEGESVSFSICGQSLGSMSAQEYITPSVIFPGDDEAALNLAQLLQSIDKDNDPSNGIEIML